MTLEHEDVDSLLDMAKHETKHIKPGEKFILRDLFKKYQWERIQDTNKKELGKKYWDYVHHEAQHIEALDKTDEGQQKYKGM